MQTANIIISPVRFAGRSHVPVETPLPPSITSYAEDISKEPASPLAGLIINCKNHVL